MRAEPTALTGAQAITLMQSRRRESSEDDAATPQRHMFVIPGQPAGLNPESRAVQRTGDSGFAQTRAQDAQLRIGE
jgi:hypothetical protein